MPTIGNYRQGLRSVELQFCETRSTDVEALFEVRAATRQNPLSRDALARLNITPESTARDLASGRAKGWVCMHQSRVVGFCTGDSHTGEVLVLAIRRDYEARGIGRELLLRVVGSLHTAGARRIWLAAASDPTVRAHGFYRALGWRPNGEHTENGDEILELHRDAR
jgi:ribosomal protein S18 acetylase RimI-like enzyme